MFQVTYQLKIPSTAIWAVILLSRRLTKQQWFSILLLPLGIAIIQLTTPAMESSSLPSFNGYASIFLIKKHASNGFVGFVAVILACLSSGFSGCYCESACVVVVIVLSMASNGTKTAHTLTGHTR